MIIIVSAAVVAGLGSLFYFRYQRNVVQVRERTNLTRLIGRLTEAKGRILRAHAGGTDISYILLQLANELETFGQNARHDRLCALAFIKRAEALRAELHYRPAMVTDAAVREQLNAARESYNKALQRITETDRPALAGADISEEGSQSEDARSSADGAAHQSWRYPLLEATARFGLGLCEEEMRNFEQAREIYQYVCEEPAFEPTVAAASARYRLDTMNDYKEDVVFQKPAPPSEAPPTGPVVPLIESSRGAAESSSSGPAGETVAESNVNPVRPEAAREPEAAVLREVNDDSETGVVETNESESP